MIVKAGLEDIQELTEIALQSKAHWNYTTEQIEYWREDLTITPERFEQWSVVKYIQDDKTVGFYALNLNKAVNTSCVEFLFVLPKYMGKAIGSQLLNHAFKESIHYKKLKMNVLSDPNAETFYAKYGFKVVDKEESSIPGRFLPIMVKDLNDLSS